jgi:DNA-binding beta-propeller fold protein YncE
MRVHNPRCVAALPAFMTVLTAATTLAWQEGVLVTSDYNSSGAIASFAREAPWSVIADRETVYADAVARWHDDLLYVVNRAGADNIQVLDPATGFATIRQYSLGLGRNLQDIAFDDQGEAYVSCYDTAELLRINPVNGQILGVISTAGFADADGLPETAWLLARGQRLFITCERLDRNHWYQPVGDSYLLVFDMTTEQWVDAAPGVPGVNGIRLAGTDPYGEPRRDGDHILVPCVGAYAVLDGGVDVVDVVQLVSLGFEITGAQLGGDVIDLTLGPDGRRLTLVSDPTFRTSIRRYDPASGQVVIVVQASGYHHADLAWDGDFQLFVADRTPLASGLRVYDALTGVQLTSAPIPTGLAPASFALPPSGPVGVPLVPLASALTLAAPWPNPANPLTTVRFAAPAGAVVRLRVVDLLGHAVREARVTAGEEGTGVWTFDGCDGQGRPVASGTYRVVGETPGGFAARALTVVR